MTPTEAAAAAPAADFWGQLFVFVLASFIGLGVIRRVSRLLHTPLMSITNAISAIAVVGSIIVTGADYPREIRILGAIALFASMTNIVSGFLITDRMLKMFKTDTQAGPGAASHEPRPGAARLHRRDGAVRLRAALDERAGHRAEGRATPAWRAWRSRSLATWAQPEVIHHGWIVLALVAGVLVGVPLSRVPLTAVPQRTALSHAFGGLAAGLVGTAKYYLWLGEGPENLTAFRMVAIIVEIILGFLTFTGSLMAAGKLQEVKWIPAAAGHLSAAERDQPRAVRDRVGGGRRARAPSDGGVGAHALSGDHRAGARVRRAADHSRSAAPTCRPSSRSSTPTPALARWRWASCWTTSS